MQRTQTPSARIRRLSLVFAVLLALGAIAPVYSAVSAQEQTEVRLTGWTASPEEDSLLVQVIADFEAKFPEIKVKYEPVPAEYPTKLQTDLAAGTVADVFYVDSLLAPDLMTNDVLLPLDDLMASGGVKTEDFYPGLIQAFQNDGTTYGLPKDFSTLAMVYDQDALTAAGVAAAPTTWDELRDAAQKLKDEFGSPRIVIPADIARYLAFHYAAGASVLNEDGTEIVLNSEEAATALDFYYGLYRDELATTPADSGAEWPGDALAKDLGDIVFEGNWVFPFLKTNAPDLKFGIAEMPAGPVATATLAFTVCYCIFNDTEVPEQAWELVNFLTGPEGMGKWTSLGLAMPARPGLSAAWLAQYPEREPFLLGGEYAKPWQLGPGGQRFMEDANGEMQNLFAGGQDVATTLANMQTRAEESIKLGQ